MVRKESRKAKGIVMLISVVLVAMVVALYFLDTSRGWDMLKIASCVIVNLWVAFIIPSLRLFWLENSERDADYWFELGGHVAISGIFIPILLAPYYGMKYYLIKT